MSDVCEDVLYYFYEKRPSLWLYKYPYTFTYVRVTKETPKRKIG